MCLTADELMKKAEKIVVIVQARIGSSRLPNKTMLSLHGHPVIEWVFRRISRAEFPDCLVFAIPDTSQNDLLADFLKSLSANVYRGNELDLLDRFYHSAKKWKATQIVRVTADCPFVSSSEIDHLIDFFQSNECDYAYNHIPVNNRYPDGIGAEIMSFEVLEKLYNEAKDPYDREHVSTYIMSHPELFKTGTFDPKDPRIHFPSIRVDLDTPEDYERLLSMKVNMDMEAYEIVRSAQALEKNQSAEKL
jgi:spore coat polysaccharide biosynthesis protein SpsF